MYGSKNVWFGVYKLHNLAHGTQNLICEKHLVKII